MTSSIFSFKIVMTSLTRSNCVALRSATFVAADNRKITHICHYLSLLNHLCMFSVYTVDPTNNNFNCFFGIWVLFSHIGTQNNRRRDSKKNSQIRTRVWISHLCGCCCCFDSRRRRKQCADFIEFDFCWWVYGLNDCCCWFSTLVQMLRNCVVAEA